MATAVLTIGCPQCGAPIEVRDRFSHAAVCDHCQSSVEFGADAARVRGRMSVLPAGSSTIVTGVGGRFEGRDFRVLGRIRYGWERGYWDEWFLGFEDGEAAWLSEEAGALKLTRPAPVSVDLSAVRAMEVGGSLRLAGSRWRISERGQAKVDGAEGQVPYVAEQDAEIEFVDLNSDDGGAATVEFGLESGGRLFVGRPVQPDELHFERQRDAFDSDEFKGKPLPAHAPDRLTLLSGGTRPLKCVQCAGSMEVSTSQDGPRHVRCPYCDYRTELGRKEVTCPTCDSAISLRSGGEAAAVRCGSCRSLVEPRTVRAVEASLPRRPPSEAPAFVFRLGDRLDVRGMELEVVGRLMYRASDGTDLWFYSEYLLYSAAHGYLWVDCEDGHFTIGGPTTAPKQSISVQRPPDTLTVRGHKMKRYPAHAESEIVYVDGEMPWVAKIGDRAAIVEYAAPPYSIALEATANEIEWYWSEYLPHREIQSATASPIILPRAEGAGFSQPPPARWQILVRLGAVGSILALVGMLASVVSGAAVLDEMLPSEVFAADGAASSSWTLDSTGLIEVEFQAQVVNQWAYLITRLERVSDGAIAAEWSEEIGYYEGSGWSEGSQSGSQVLYLEEPGEYRIVVEGESGRGNSQQPDPQLAPRLTLAVRSGVWLTRYFGGAFAVFAVLAVFSGLALVRHERLRMGAEFIETED